MTKTIGIQVSGRSAEIIEAVEKRLMRLEIKPNRNAIVRAALAFIEVAGDQQLVEAVKNARP